ncbi:MAG: hypothetical protein ACKVRP_15450 [Bacteroidota bacterium]
MPSWDVNLTLPLANREYSLLEIVRKDTSLLRVGTGGQIIYATSAGAPPTFIGDLIAIDPPDTTAEVEFGTFAVTTPPLQTGLQVPWLPGGAITPIPDTNIVFADIAYTIPTFQSVTFANGTITLTLQNNMPVPLEVNAPVEVFDAQQRLVASFIFTPSVIPPYSSRSASDGLAERTTGNNIRITGLAFHTPGSATPVEIPQGDIIVATLHTSNVQARRATFAQIPPQRLASDDTTMFSLDDSTLVKEVGFRSGTLDFTFTSRVDLDILFKFRMNELRSVQSVSIPYEDSIYLPARGTGSFSLNLAQYKIQSSTGDLVRSLQVISNIVLPSGSVAPVTVNDTDKVDIMLSSTPLIVDTAVAVVKPTWVDVNAPIAINFGDLPTRFSGQISIPSATLGLATSVSFGFPLDLYVSIGARRYPSGDWVYLQIPASQKRIQPGTNAVNFNQNEVGYFLSQFTNQLPDTLYVMGQVLVNPPEVYNPTLAGVGSFGSNSSFGGTVHLEVPLMLGIVDGAYRDTLAIGDTTGDGQTDYTVNKSRIRDVNFGKIFIEVQNGMPLQVGVNLALLNNTRQSLLSIPQSGSPVLVNAAAVDNDGNVTLAARSTSTIELSAHDVRQFDPSEFMTYALSLITTPGSPAVRFKTTDYIRIRVWSTLSYRVN